MNPGPERHHGEENQLTHDQNPNTPFSVHDHIEIDPHMVTVLDWFILEGGDHDETQFGLGSIDAVTLDGIDYYFGDSTCDVDHHLVEVAALASLGAPFDTGTLWSMVEPLATRLDGHNMDIDVSGDEEQAVWVTCRLSDLDLVPDRIGLRLGELVTLATKVRALISS